MTGEGGRAYMIPVMEADFDRYLLRIEKELDKEERLIKEKEKTDF